MASLHVYSASVERVHIIETTFFFSRMMGMNGGQDSEGRAKKRIWEHPCDSVSGRKMLYFQQVTIMGPNEKVCVTVTCLRAGSAVGPSSVCEQATRHVYTGVVEAKKWRGPRAGQCAPPLALSAPVPCSSLDPTPGGNNQSVDTAALPCGAEHPVVGGIQGDTGQ